MSSETSSVDRVLLVHADAATRLSVTTALRGVGSGNVTVYEASGSAEAVEETSRLDPRVVLLDIGESQSLALDVVREIRGPDRLIIGLYNPLVVGENEGKLLRMAARAGVADFLHVPVSETELLAALTARHALGGKRDTDPEGRMIAFFSSKGGVGTTTLAVNAALAMAESRADGEVVICDANLQFGDVTDWLGLRPDRDIGDLVADLDQLGPIESYLVREPRTGLLVLPRPRKLVDAELVAPDDLSRVLIALRRRFSIVIVDVPAALDLLTLAALDLCETTCFVTEPVAPTVLSTGRCLAFLEEQGLVRDRVRVVLNHHGLVYGGLTDGSIEEELGRSVDNTLPHDAKGPDAADLGEPLVLRRHRTDFSRAVTELASALAPVMQAAREGAGGT